MNKIYIAIAAVVVILLALMLNLSMRTKSSTSLTPTPTFSASSFTPGSSIQSPSPTKYVAQPQVAIVSSNPPNEAKDISLDQAISVTFESSIPIPQVTIIIQPPAILQRSVDNQTLTFKPSISWKPAVAYSYMMRYKDQFSNVYTFNTVGGTPTPYVIPPQDTVEINQRNALEKHPDVYLHNLLPYTGSAFKMEYAVNKSADTSYDYYFVVTNLNGSDVHEAVKQWLLSQKLSEAQIAKLDIRY